MTPRSGWPYIAEVATTLMRRDVPKGMSSLEALAFGRNWQAAVGEALSLLRLEARGCTSRTLPCRRNCSDISDVLDIDAADRQALREFAAQHPEEHEMVVESLKFRQMVQAAVVALRELEAAA